MPNGTYDIVLYMTNSTIATGTGFNLNMIGQAPRA
jgi:hypothetical protein